MEQPGHFTGHALPETRQYNSMFQLTRMTATTGGQAVMDMQYTFSRNQNNGADHAIDGPGERGDGGLHLRHAESAGEGGDDLGGVGRGVHLRWIRESDGEDTDERDGSFDDGVVRCVQSPGGAELRCEWEYGGGRDVPV